MRDAVDPTAKNELKSEKKACANQRLIASANQRLQIRRIRAIEQEHAEDNTGERARAKMIRA